MTLPAPSPYPEHLRQLASDAWGDEHWNWDGSLRKDVRRCWRCGGPARVVEKQPVFLLPGSLTTYTLTCPVCDFTTTLT